MLKIARWATVDANEGNDAVIVGANQDFPGLSTIKDMLESVWGFEWSEEFLRDTWKPELLADLVAEELKNEDVLQMK